MRPKYYFVIGVVGLLWSIATTFTYAAPLAWQIVQAYQGDTIQGGVNSKNWSPKSGTITGDVVPSGGTRYTQMGVQNLAWSQQNINWMRNEFVNGSPAITFHAVAWNNGCTSWQADNDYYLGTNVPSPVAQRLTRNGCTNNEIRIFTDEDSLIANGQYWAQAKYWDHAYRSQAKISVDTYWVVITGDANYHQHYCIPNNQDLAKDRTNC